MCLFCSSIQETEIRALATIIHEVVVAQEGWRINSLSFQFECPSILR